MMRTLRDCINSQVPVVFIILIVIVQLLSGNQTGRHTYVVRYKHGSSLIPVTVVLDYKRQTEYVINMNSRSPAKSMTLYDFKERVIAYKDLKNGECFIGKLEHETIHDEDSILKRLKNPVDGEPLILTLEPDHPSLTPTAVRNMAGHKIAVFCRRMNTWMLMPEKANRREKRDALRRPDRSSSHLENHRKPNHVSPQKNDITKVVEENTDRTRNDRDFSSFRSNGSLSIIHRTSERSDIPAPFPGISTEHRELNNVFPFILPRQRSSAEKDARQNFPIRNTTVKSADDSFLNIGFNHERSSVQALPEFPRSQSPSATNGKLISSAKRTFIPLHANHPVIIPSISFPASSPENKVLGTHGVNEMSSPSVIPGSYSQSINNFLTSQTRGKILDSYPPPLQQLPPEAFVLPLTRPSTVTTAPPFIFSNNLGHEIVHPDSSTTYNNTDLRTGLDRSPSTSLDSLKPVLSPKSDETILDLQSSSFKTNLDKHQASSNIPSIPLHSDNRTHNNRSEASVSAGKKLSQPGKKETLYDDSYDKQLHVRSHELLDGTQRSYTESNTSSVSRFNDIDAFSADRNDPPIQIPRWYPEITKQISIPLEIEVLDHQEDYTHSISNGTSFRGHEVEDPSSFPLENTAIPFLIETHSNGTRYESTAKLLPQVSYVTDTDFLTKASDQVSRRQGEKLASAPEPREFRQSRYPIYTGNTSLHEIFPHTNPLLTNGTEVKDSTRSLGIASVPVSGVRQNSVDSISDPASSYKETFEQTIKSPRQHQANEGALPVHDVKIDEGLPSYRKRLPVVSQLFSAEETVSDVGRLPDRDFRLRQARKHAKRKPPATRNKTRGTTPRGYESKSIWGKQNLGSNNLINRQQMSFKDQGITFHQRGYAKPGVPEVPYDHRRKRLGILPPGVSIHPRHPQAPYADMATETADRMMPVDPLLNSRPRRVHLRHHRRHQRKRNRFSSSPDLSPSAPNCCNGDTNCCSSRRRSRHFPKAGGCCSQPRESRIPNLGAPSPADKNEVSPRKKVEEVVEDRCMKEKMCRTVYQSTKKVLVCRNIPVEGC